ncbi:MAG: YcbK family protein [Gammaproteobacteria bacterium]
MCTLCEEPLSDHGQARRRIVFAGAAAGALLLAPAAALAARRPRALDFYHTHTGQRLRVTYAEGDLLIPGALEEINEFLRDFRSGEAHPMDPELLNILHQLQTATGGKGPYEIISAFRSPQTNNMLRANSDGVAQRSLHMEGRAMDVRLKGVETRKLRQAALALQAGGVGYYQRSDFIHVDTGRVRFW